MNIWKNKMWEVWNGTWLIASATMTDTQITQLIWSNPDKYGMSSLWYKIT